MTYVADFFKRLFRKENIPMIIYLIINLVLVFVGTSLIVSVVVAESGTAMPEAALIAISILASIAIYGLGIVIALSPLGEFILRTKLGCKPVTDQAVLNRIMPLFNEVHAAARRLNPSIANDIKLFISEDNSPNAFATGRKTICINTGLLKLSDMEIKGILAHEFGHIANHDTDFTLVVNVANWIVTAYFTIAWVLIMVYKFIMKAIALIVSIASDSIGAVIASILGGVIVDAMVTIGIRLFSAIWTLIGNLLIKASSRSNEFLADKFAKQAGFASGLLMFFNRYATAKPKLSFKEKLASLGDTHPATSLRINELMK